METCWLYAVAIIQNTGVIHMKKRNFAMLVLGCIGGLLFSLGLCMCLLPEWNAFQPGAACTATGLVTLLALLAFALKAKGRSGKKINWKLVGKAAFGVLGALVLGAGMCMVMVWNRMLPGIVVGILGIVMLLMLIPMFLGLK